MKKLFALGSLRSRSSASVLSTIAASLTCSVALAHPGHHGSDWLHAAVHMLTEPDHLASILFTVGVAVLVWRSVRRRAATNKDANRRQP